MKDKLYKMRNKQSVNGLTDLIGYINDHVDTKTLTMVEVGSYAGESTEIFAKHFKKVIAIDPYINDYDPKDITCRYMELEKVFFEFDKVLTLNKNITHIRKTSDEAIKDLIGLEFDFVYIDGLHTYEQVLIDIENYSKIVKVGGFIGGHDYHPNVGGVMRAVDESIKTPKIKFLDTSWITTK
jgi:cephalosporin hydroxylase